MDYIIKDGWIVNGKKEKPFHGDLVIENGKIAEVGTHVEIPADFPKERVLNAAGGYITPGFLDIHRHGDWQAFGIMPKIKRYNLKVGTPLLEHPKVCLKYPIMW